MLYSVISCGDNISDKHFWLQKSEDSRVKHSCRVVLLPQSPRPLPSPLHPLLHKLPMGTSLSSWWSLKPSTKVALAKNLLGSKKLGLGGRRKSPGRVSRLDGEVTACFVFAVRYWMLLATTYSCVALLQVAANAFTYIVATSLKHEFQTNKWKRHIGNPVQATKTTGQCQVS